MKKSMYLLFLLIPFKGITQVLSQKLAASLEKLSTDPQFKHAIMSLVVMDGKNNLVFEKNSDAGLVPASCQKIITSASAFELLGSSFEYTTHLLVHSSASGYFLELAPSGDPTLGSFRWERTNRDSIYKMIGRFLKEKNVDTLAGIILNGQKNSELPVPKGWVWEDIGNYFGAGAWWFNWNENKYDLVLQPGSQVGQAVAIKAFDPPEARVPINNYLTAGREGSGDRATIYSAPYAELTFAKGTVPVNQKDFIVSASMTNPSTVFTRGLAIHLKKNNIFLKDSVNKTGAGSNRRWEMMFTSPSLDSINTWFLKKSINLFGEALVKTIAWEKCHSFETDSGIAIIKNFWEKNGIEKSALKIIDGSGLSPANRITGKAIVQVLLYAKKQNWFPSFYDALPEMNGIRMKDGYITGVRTYAGYVKNKMGDEFVFSFMVNNADGNPSSIREKMWKVLDLLK
jgi:D-alanyl-D-alanine carboxypeptidase/D-alanyl-D-alanine-endopeptidase (penicillin-binding protein 4)